MMRDSHAPVLSQTQRSASTSGSLLTRSVSNSPRVYRALVDVRLTRGCPTYQMRVRVDPL
jgi:hypothetical protein